MWDAEASFQKYSLGRFLIESFDESISNTSCGGDDLRFTVVGAARRARGAAGKARDWVQEAFGARFRLVCPAGVRTGEKET
jgi:hypothetical protein